MKNIKRIIMALGLSACVALGAVGFTACEGTVSEAGKSAYEIWLDNGHTGSETDFLEWLKGEQGPQGEKGDKGEDGKDGVDGKDGADGKDGKSAYDIWLEAGHNGTEEDFLEWLRDGCDCNHSGSEQDPEEEVFSAEISIPGNGTTDMPISGLSAGVHIIEADLGEKNLASASSRLQAKIGEGGLSELVYSESRSTEGHNIYYGYIQIGEDDTAITFSTISQGTAVNATVYIKNWEMPTLSVGVPVEMPINIYGTTTDNLIKIKLDPLVTAGNYTIAIDGDSSLSNTLRFYIGSSSAATISASTYSGKAFEIKADDIIGDEIYCYLIVGVSSDVYKQINPVTVTLTAN